MNEKRLSKTRLYDIWNLMKQRCNNPNRPDFKWYGAKGIRVYAEWEHDFKKFYKWAMDNGYDDTLTIDRLESGNNYAPGNCRWIPFSRQREKTTQSILVTINGETKNLKAWCTKYGANYNTVYMRVKRGMSAEKAIKTPIRKVI